MNGATGNLLSIVSFIFKADVLVLILEIVMNDYKYRMWT